MQGVGQRKPTRQELVLVLALHQMPVLRLAGRKLALHQTEQQWQRPAWHPTQEQGRPALLGRRRAWHRRMQRSHRQWLAEGQEPALQQSLRRAWPVTLLPAV